MKEQRMREIAAGILGCGKNRVWIDPKESEKTATAMTKEDVRALVQSGVITKRSGNSQSRGRARKLKEKKRKGRKSGKGKRKGTKKARSEKKESWIKNVRSQRKTLKELRAKKPKEVKKIGYRSLYKRVKGGYFRGKKYLSAAVEGSKE
jgi:large subunit ribosomal protein L19e